MHTIPQEPYRREEDQQGVIRRNRTLIIVALLSFLSASIGSYAGFKARQSQTDVDFVKATYERMKELERQVSSLQSQFIEQSAEVVQLKVQLNNAVSVYVLLEELVDGFQFPAWVKRVEYNAQGEAEFPMALINKAYEYRFGVSKHRYTDSRDARIWPDAVAEAFKRNDERVLKRRASGTYIEQFPEDPGSPVSKDNPLSRRTVTKVYLKFTGHPPMILGMLMPQTD